MSMILLAILAVLIYMVAPQFVEKLLAVGVWIVVGVAVLIAIG